MTKTYGLPGDELFDERKWAWLASVLWPNDPDCYGKAGVLLRIACLDGGMPLVPVLGLSRFDCYELRMIWFLERLGLVRVAEECVSLADDARSIISRIADRRAGIYR